MALTSPVFEEVTDLVPFDPSEFPAANEVAIATPVNTLAASTNNNALATLASMGFEGLEDDFRTSPLISLKTHGVFEDANGQSFGTTFNCYLIGSVPKWAYSFDGSKDPVNELAYSYDKVTTARGGSLEAFKAGLVAKGKVVTEKRYTEATIAICEPGTARDGESHKLSISPASASAWTLHMKALLRHNLVLTGITKVSVGKRTKYGNNPEFFPWEFAIQQ